MIAFKSPAEARAVALAEFEEQYRFTCGCRRQELRLEGAALLCARCDAPIIRRARSGMYAKAVRT
jgi:NADH pyrophosphatase NudC (nudix superfamily)